MAAENEVYIETALDTKSLEKGIAKTKTELKSLEKSYQNLKDKQRQFLSGGGEKFVLSEEYKKASAEAEKLGLSLERALNRKEKLDETGAKKNTQSYKQLEHDIDQLSEKFWRAEKAKEALEGTKYVENPAWTKMQSDVQQVESRMQNAKTVLSSYENQLVQLKSKAGNIDAIRKAFDGTRKSAVGFNKIMKSVMGRLGQFGAKSKQVFGGGFKNILKYAIGIRSLFILVNQLRSALVEGFKNLAQFNDGLNPTNRALSNLKSSFTQLKNSLATAFAPILTVIEPILTSFISKINQAITSVGMLIAKLTGAKTFTKAVAVQEDFAQSLSDTADSAKDAKKEMEKYLSPLDEVNKVSEKTSTSSGSGSGSVSPNDMFEEVSIPENVNSLADRIKKAWLEDGFVGIGEMIAEKLNKEIKNADTKKIGETVAKFVKSGIDSWYGFVKEFNFSQLGTKIADSINAFFKSMNTVDKKTGLNGWQKLGKSISKTITGFADMIITALNTVDWKSVGQAIGDFISSIDWGQVVFDFAKLGASIINAIIDVIIGWADKDPLSASIAGLISLGAIIAKLALSAEEIAALKALGGTIFGWIAAGMIAAVAGYKLGKEIGKALFPDDKELYDSASFKDYLEAVKYFFTEMIPNAIGDVFINIKAKFEDNKNTLKQKWNELTQHIKDKHPAVYVMFKTTQAMVKAKYEAITKYVKDKYPEIAIKWRDTKEKIRDKFNNVVSNVKDKNVKISFVLQKWNDIKAGLKSIINSMIDFLNTNFIGKLNKLFKVTIPKNAATDFLGINGTYQIVNIPNIPKLATGAVIPANREFMAMLGDQKHGTNLEAPESLIRKIVREESGNGNGTINLNVQLDGRTVYQRVIDIAKLDQTVYGNNPFSLA